jgi:hypothetical protein
LSDQKLEEIIVRAPRRMPLIHPSLFRGDTGAVTGEFAFWTNLANMYPTDVILRAAGDTQIGELIHWRDRIHAAEPKRVKLVHFPTDRATGFYHLANGVEFAAVALSSDRAILLRDCGRFIPQAVPRASWNLENGSVSYHIGGVA